MQNKRITCVKLVFDESNDLCNCNILLSIPNKKKIKTALCIENPERLIPFSNSFVGIVYI